MAADEDFRTLADCNRHMIEAYRRRAWAEARDLIAACRRLDRFELRDFYDLYERRIADFVETPPDADWQGVFVATEK